MALDVRLRLRNKGAMSEAGDGIGSLATGALWARTFGNAEGGHAGHDEAGLCANCGTERIGAYCHRCGQAGHLHRNLMGLVHDIAHGVFHFEGKLWKTLPMLAWHPGRLTRRYVDGERAKFVSPMALFLFSVFLMFAVVSNISSHQQAKVVRGQDAAAKLKGAQAKLAGLEATQATTTDADAKEEIADQINDAKEEVQALSVASNA